MGHIGIPKLESDRFGSIYFHTKRQATTSARWKAPILFMALRWSRWEFRGWLLWIWGSWGNRRTVIAREEREKQSVSVNRYCEGLDKNKCDQHHSNRALVKTEAIFLVFGTSGYILRDQLKSFSILHSHCILLWIFTWQELPIQTFLPSFFGYYWIFKELFGKL